jgi:hypothetical protein
MLKINRLGLFDKIWCWITGGTWYTPDPYANGGSGNGQSANGEVLQEGCNYDTDNGGGSGSPSSRNNTDDSSFKFSYVYTTGDGTVTAVATNEGGGASWGPPPCPPTQTSNTYTTAVKLKTNKVDTGDGSGCPTTGDQGQWVPYLIDPALLSPQLNTLDTISDISLRNNIKANCIYQSLKNNTIFAGLISAYLDNPTYNLGFKVGPLADTLNGLTQYNASYSNSKVLIIINTNHVDDRYALDVARTFIHEAYHAYITQILIEHGGPFGIFVTRSDFNKDLNQIFDAYIDYGVDIQRTDASKRGVVFNDNDAQHAIMAQEIDKIATGVKQYVEAKYPNIVNNPNITFDNYRAVAWSGLQSTNAFKNTWGSTSNQTYNNLILTLKTNTTYDCQ